ncbi:hypothetical protein JKF63_02172 [Porcisia hertigi]|uniref:Uncharacterized protein n=1 Tax=Porcisia hertigi TaxID=2761500 RepID=A0A836HLT2_9TRYP|nr:hypothetical protein JKF63_02172 [Porcisia hertigi]
MLSFKSIAGFLKKVGRSREDNSREGHQKGGANENHAGAGINGAALAGSPASAATGDASDGAHSRPYSGSNRNALSNSPNPAAMLHHGDAAHDSNLSEFPTSGMLSTFGDNVTLTSSHILTGLQPNTSNQDVLLHIQRAVRERSEQLQQQEREEQQRSSNVLLHNGSDGSAAAGSESTSPAAAKRQKGFSPIPMAANDGTDTRTAQSDHAHLTGPANLKADKATPAVARDHVHKLQKMRAEMIDALDVCLQEVPEDPFTWGSSNGGTYEGDRGRNAKNAADAHPQERSSGAPDSTVDNNNDGLAEGTRTELELVAPRQEIPTAANSPGVAEPTTALSHESPSPPDFGYYEWRRLLMEIINLLVRIDRALLQDVRLRALGRPVPANNRATSYKMTEFRWEHLSQVFPTPAECGQTPGALEGVTSGSRRSQVPFSSTPGPVGHSPHGETAPLNSPLHSRNADPAAVVRMATPRESIVTPATTKTAARTTSISSSRSMGKRALVDNSVISPDPPVDLVVTKEDKKMVEELLTIACSLATWAIVKAILRHHLHTLEQRQSRNSLSPLNREATASMASARLSADMSASATSTEVAGAGNTNATGRPPLAPPAPPPPAVMNSAACPSDGAESEAGVAAASAATDCDQGKSANNVNVVDEVETIPYIDWAAVVQELSEWIGEQHSVTLAECILCASFLRDDGREMVLCMLQTPKPRRLLTSIHQNADKLRRAHLDSSLSCASPPRMATAATAPAGISTTTVTAPSGSVPAATSSPLTSSGTPSTSSGSGAAAATPLAGTSTSTTQTGATSFLLTPKRSYVAPAAGASLPPNTTRAMPEDPTLVMDDLVAQLEMIYRKAVANTWASYLEDAIEADMRHLSISSGTTSGAPGISTVSNPVALSTSTAVTHLTTAGEELSRQSVDHTAANAASPPLLTQPHQERITDTKTLCRLATAFFFGSDAWPENKRDRLFALLFRSMRGRMERYSESAATRRNMRRGTSYLAFPTHTPPSALAIPLEPHPFVELPMAGAPAATTAPSSTGASPSQSLSNPPQMTSTAPSAPSAVAGMTPTKFSVEDTSTRAPPSGGGSTAFSTAGGVGTPTTARHGVAPSPQLAVQILSSNGSTAAISTHSTPLTASLLASRDGGTTDVDMSVTGTGGSNPCTDILTVGQTDRPTSWTPFAFAMTPPEPSTPPPESHHLSSSNTAQRGAEEGHQEGGEDHAGRRTMETSALSIPTVNLHVIGTAVQPTASKGGDSALESLLLERIVNMSWSAALHKRGEQCLTAKPPRLDEAEQDALEERLVASAFSEFRARQRAIVSLINARLASGKSVEALSNAQKHFKFEKKDWTSHNQTIFSAMRYLQSMVFLVRAQAACRVYGAVIETVQFVLPQAALCEQMLQVLAPRPRGDYILRFGDCRSKLLRSYVYLLKEGWLAHAAFNDLAKAEKYFVKCAQVMQMLRRRVRETELFAAYMERGAQLMKLKDYKQSVELFRCAVKIAKKSLQVADTAANASGEGTTFSPGSTIGSSAPPPSSSSMANVETAASVAATGLVAKLPPAASQKHFHRNLHLRAAGSGSLTTAEEHIPGVTDAVEDDLELVWRVAESERMLALSFVTQAEHEVNVRERREELSNAVTSAYSSQRSLQRWQRMGGTPKRLLTAVPCSLIVICKGLLLLNQPRKAALLLEPLIENKPNSSLVRPPMWEEILHPTEDPYTTEDVVLRTYVSTVKIAVFMIYARCLAEFDGDRALRAVTQVDQLLQESDAWICTIRNELHRALEDLGAKDKAVTGNLNSPRSAQRIEVLRNGDDVSSRGAVGHGPNSEDGEDAQSYRRQNHGNGAEPIDPASTAAVTAAKGTARTIEVPHLQMPTSHSSTGSPSPVDEGRYSQGWNSSDDAPLRLRQVTVAGTGAKAQSTSAHNDPLLGGDGPGAAVMEDDDRSHRSTSIQMSGAGGDRFEMDAASAVNNTNAALTSSTSISTLLNHQSSHAKSPNLPPIRVHTGSSSKCMTALFALREAKSHIRKALRDIFIVSGDAHSLIKNWEEALKVYSHALVITMSEVEAASAAAQSRRCAGKNTLRPHFAPPKTPKDSINMGKRTPPSASDYANKSPRKNGGDDTSNCLQGWGPVVPLDEEFFLWDEEDVLIADNLVNRELTASTAARDLRAVVADEERMDSRACESVVLSKLAKVYHALEKPTTAIHYHTLVMEYANECNDKLLAYNSVLSLARLYTAANMNDKARDAWARVSDLAKEYEDKEVSRETMRNIVAGQEAAGMYMEVVKTAEELEKLATGEEGEDAARDSRFALEALANANLQLGQFDACIAALDSREKVQEKSAEWSGALLSMRAKARIGLNKPAEAIKVMHSWAAKARNLGNWVELGKANSALSSAYASENQNTLARRHHEAALRAFALVETLDEECRHIALDSARWLVHYAYLDETTVQVDPALTYTGDNTQTSDSEMNDGNLRYTDNGLANLSGDLGVLLAREEELRRTSSMFGDDSTFERNDDDVDFGGENLLSNQSMFGGRPPGLLLDQDTMAPADGDSDDDAGEAAADEDDAQSLETSFTSPLLAPKDSSLPTQPPSFASSMKVSIRGLPGHTDDSLGSDKDHSECSSSSAGQSDGGENEVGDDVEDEARRRLEVDAAPRPTDTEDAAEHRQDSQRAGSIEGEEAIDLANQKKPPPKPAPVASTPTVTTAALKPTTNTSTVTGSGAPASKSASSTYVPPPTSLANVSICSRPAAAAAGTDVLELQVDVNRPTAEHATLSGPNSPLLSCSPRGSAVQAGLNATAGAASVGADNNQERKPSTVRMTYFRGALEIIETAAQMLLVPRSGRHIVIPYSPAEAVDFALLTHPQSLFVFYFAEYTTEYGAQCDVIVRPPRTAGFIKLRVQVSLKEYHSKDAISARMASTSTEISMTGDHNSAAETAGSVLPPAHPFGTTMARTVTGGSAASLTPSNEASAGLRAALNEETLTCLRNLYADAWQPIVDRMRREHVTYQDAETVIIMPDVSMMHLPFAGFSPSSNYGEEEEEAAPLGEQFTLIVTPSMTHFVNHGMTQQPHRRNETSGALDPAAEKYIFLPYDSRSAAGAVAPSAPLAMSTFTVCAPSTPSVRPQQQPKTSAGAAEASTATALTPMVESTSSKAPLQSSAAPLVLPAHSLVDSVPTGHPTAASATVDDTGVRNNLAPADITSAPPSSRPKLHKTQKSGTFDELLRTWRVYRGCTRKELIQAFTDVHTRAMIFLPPIDQGSVRVADGVVTIHDLAQNLLQIRAQQQSAANAANTSINPSTTPTNAAASTSNAASFVASNNTPGATVTTTPPPLFLIPPLCTHMDLLILTANRSQYPTVSDPGASAKLCMELGVHRVLRLNILHGLSPNDEQCTFIALYLANLKKVMRWSLRNPYAVALRTTIAEARKLGMSSNTWGAFTLMGNP